MRSEEKRQCDALVFGSLLLWLRDLGLWPEKELDGINHVSVDDLASELQSIEVYKWPEFSAAYDAPHRVVKHDRCGLSDDMEAGVARVMRRIPSPALKSHIDHIKAQKEKMGPNPQS